MQSDAVRLQDRLDDAAVGQAQLGDPSRGRCNQQPPLPRVRQQVQVRLVGDHDQDAGTDVTLVSGNEKEREKKKVRERHQ